MLKFPLKWRRNNTFVGWRRKEPSYDVGSSDLYGTGASVGDLEDSDRKNYYGDPPRHPEPEEMYVFMAWFKRGNMTVGTQTSGFTRTPDEAKSACDKWLRMKTGTPA